MEFNPPSISVDVTDPADAAKKLPKVREAAVDAKLFADKATTYAETLAAMVKYLETLSEAGVSVWAKGDQDAVVQAPNGAITTVEVKSATRRSTSRDAVVEVATTANGPISIADVSREHPEIPHETLRGMFKRLTKDGTIVRVGRGRYTTPNRAESTDQASLSLPGGSEE